MLRMFSRLELNDVAHLHLFFKAGAIEDSSSTQREL